jgi:hypothetical protein
MQNIELIRFKEGAAASRQRPSQTKESDPLIGAPGQCEDSDVLR